MRRLGGGAAAVGALIAVSTVARAFAARAIDVPWIVPDEYLYAALGDSLWSHGKLLIRDEPVGFYTALVPLVGGWPFAAFDTQRAIVATQWLGAALVSLTAVPVFLWGKTLVAQRWAVAAAAVTLAAPGFLYSGLIMSEALFVPICVLALWSLAHLLIRPALLEAGVFLALVTLACAVRLQALIFVPVAVGAALWFAASSRSATILRRLAPIGLAGVGVGAVTLLAVLAGGGELSWRNALGAYAEIAESRPSEGSLVSGVAWQVVALASGALVAPLGALVALAWVGLRARADERTNAFVAVAVSWTAFVLVQSGLFATAYTGTAAGRYLVTTVPLTAIALCVWCGRGGVSRGVAAAACLAAGALALLVPLETIAGSAAFSANPFAAPLTWLYEDGRQGLARAILVGVAVVAAVGLVLANAGRLRFLVVPLLAALVAVSAMSYARASSASAAERSSTIGDGDPAWLDQAAGGAPVSMILTGGELWTGVARTLFWNENVRRVFALPEAQSAPIAATPARLEPDGSVLPAPMGLVATSTTVQLDGELVATSPSRGSATFPWRLWRASMPVRVVAVAELGVDPVGDLTGHVRITVPGCQRGALWITFIGKTDVSITVFRDGEEVSVVELEPGETPTISFPSPPGADGTRPCVYDLDVPTLTGSTRLEYLSG
ncbi:MAG: hypothetical protein U0R50_04130 [Gaiellales bacterium]